MDINQGEEVVYLDNPDNLLNALAKQGIAAEAQCRDGFCGSCKCELVEGDVEYLQAALAFIQANEILPCICKPLTSLKLSQVTYHIQEQIKAK
ncbi:class I ribonucleotide reductase maintenance protein YfaE [Thaumasiovibrio sp. DFM-14]|uniref:class I ribonucleotide reductase maintenance protein YfaE n=1 Tax=Thaumasiovibrio sp. DFM-14 TaxID=3384792 RepID=UPI00399F71C1